MEGIPLRETALIVVAPPEEVPKYGSQDLRIVMGKVTCIEPSLLHTQT